MNAELEVSQELVEDILGNVLKTGKVGEALEQRQVAYEYCANLFSQGFITKKECRRACWNILRTGVPIINDFEDMINFSIYCWLVRK